LVDLKIFVWPHLKLVGLKIVWSFDYFLAFYAEKVSFEGLYSTVFDFFGNTFAKVL